ncbi:wall-associated receptor kinase-like 14 [Typha latifolia]|uniref:wall-associated receptor kinase-like 14 n=1 Tax=Typha latifolia TaxID=4733 RepID=UPI003C2DCF6E
MLRFLLLLLLLALSSIEPIESTVCDRTCGSTTVSYPFGFSDKCPIRLSCNSTGGILIAGYPLLDFLNGTLHVDISPSCNRSIHTAARLFGSNYAMTWRTGLFLRNCSAKAQSECLIPTSVISRISRQLSPDSCGKQGDNITCYSNARTDGFLSKDSMAGTGCQFLFTSVLYSADQLDMPALVFNTAELEWWLTGKCRCSANAIWENVTTPMNGTGCRCACREGFKGDGFADGSGCVKDCGGSNKKSGACSARARVGIIVGGIIGGVALVLGLALCYNTIRRKSLASKDHQTTKRLLSEASCIVPLYSYKEMERATNSFSNTHKLGTGGYGIVYVGKLHNDELVAVKRIRHRDANSIGQVMNEIKLISAVSHPNLVRLLGCCIDKNEQILVYEFMPNGTLSQHLHREKGRGLSWPVRLNIAVETAKAIAYLHAAIHPPIYHRDIKSSNILLDRDFNPKVADFGLSRIGMTESSHISTAPQGTLGYLDPQYHQSFHLSDKSDVYSFGVVLVEIVTAMKVVDFSRAPSEVSLASLAVDRIGRGLIEDILDPYLRDNEEDWIMESIRKVAELAFRCLAFHSDVRPSMTEVAEELKRIRISGPNPIQDEENELGREAGLSSSLSGGRDRLSGKSRSSRGMRLVVSGGGKVEEVRVDSPVSVQDVWVSEQSSPSTNGSLPRFLG